MARIKKQMDAINKQERDLRNVREVMMCDCCHTRSGDLNIVPKQNRQNGELLYLCKECTKDLNLKKIEENEARSAIDIVDRMCDVIKISLDTSREDEAKMAKKLSKVQYRVRNDLLKLYSASLKKNRNGGRNNRRDGGNDGGVWNKPTINGR